MPSWVETTLTLPRSFPRALGVGSDLKNRVCLVEGCRAYLSAVHADLTAEDDYAAFLGLLDAVGDVPLAACDLHPRYVSRQVAMRRYARVCGVPHHRAHVLACAAENGFPDTLIGVAYDGTGYGPDGTVWGGEVLLKTGRDWERAACLAPVGMPGGTAAIREPWRMGVGCLVAACGRDAPETARRVFADLAPGAVDAVVLLAAKPARSPRTSSCGRLFDAVSAILGLCRLAASEGQAAIALMEHAAGRCAEPYPIAVGGDVSPRVIDSVDLVRRIVADREDGVDTAELAARFHATLADATVRACARIAQRTGAVSVALTGGCFYNALLKSQVECGLRAHGMTPLTPTQLGPGDAALGLGQAIAASL